MTFLIQKSIEEKTEYFIQDAIYFDCFIGVNFKGFHKKCDIFIPSGGKAKEYWANKNLIEIACYGWKDYVDSSKTIYDKYKNNVLLSHGKYSCLRLDKISTFVKNAIKNQINKEVFNEYKDDIRSTTSVPLPLIKMIAYSNLYKLYPIYSFYYKYIKFYRQSLQAARKKGSKCENKSENQL